MALNGRTGVVLRHATLEGVRVAVRLDKGGRTVHVQPESVRPIEAAPPPPFLPLSTVAAVNDPCSFHTYGNMPPTSFLPGVGMHRPTAIVLVLGIRDFQASLCAMLPDRKGGAAAAARRLH